VRQARLGETISSHHCFKHTKPEIHQKQQTMHFHFIMNTTQSPEMQNRNKIRQNELQHETLASHTCKNYCEGFWYEQRSTTAPRTV